MVIFDPIECTSCENLYCKECIELWKLNADVCPKRCKNFQTKKINRILKNQLLKLIFKCNYVGCN